MFKNRLAHSRSTEYKWFKRGRLQSRHKQAIDFFQTLVHRYPTAPQAYDSLAWGYAKSGKAKLAMAEFTKALGIKPDFNRDYSVDNYQSLTHNTN